MAHDRPDDEPEAAAPALPALALPGGPDGECGAVPPPCPAGLGSLTRPAGLCFSRTASAACMGLRRRTVWTCRPVGSAMGRRPAAAPAANADRTSFVEAGGSVEPGARTADSVGVGAASTLPLGSATPKMGLDAGAGELTPAGV